LTTSDPDALVEPGDLVHARRVWPLHPDSDEAADLYVLGCLWWGEYTGDAIARSNHRSLIRDYPDTFIGLFDTFDANGLALPPDFTDPHLTGVLEHLTDYPLYDEDDYSTLTIELAEQAWDDWLCFDVPALLIERHNLDPETVGISEQDLRQAFFRLYGERFADEYAETAAFPHLDQAITLLADHIRPHRPAT
jgi:hypothetical protein